MQELFTLGELYPSDFLQDNEAPRSNLVEMKLMLTSDGNVRLEKIAPLNVMFAEKYWYASGINNTMRDALKDIVYSINKMTKLKENDLWIDIASNDGTLLSFVSPFILRVGIDPVDDTFKHQAEKHSNLIIQDYFSAAVFKASKFGSLKAKVITSIAMFYDLENPDSFIQDVHEVLDDNGLWVMQLSYTPLMIKQMAFDNICHEHVYYYSLFNLKALLEKNGFKIMDCQLNDINGGSFRVYIMKDLVSGKNFSSQPHRDVCQMRVNSLLEYEKSLNLDKKETWLEFFASIEKLKEETVAFIKAAKAQGKTVYGYGASTKGNTLLQYFGLDSTLITAIAERSTPKWGLKTIGTNIPIISEDEMRSAKPDYLLCLPWHFINEFKEREKDLLQQGTQFIVPCPRFEIIGIND